MRSVRLAFGGTRLVLPLILSSLQAACLLVSPLDDVSESGSSNDDGVVGSNGGSSYAPGPGGAGSSGAGGAGGTAASGAGGTGNTNAGGTGNSSSGGTEGGVGGNLPVGNGASPGLGGAGGTESAPSVASWCPDPVALFAQNNPYVASFTFVSGDCLELDDVEYRAGVEPAPNCTIMEERLPPEFCGYQEIETCTDVLVDATRTADAESLALILQLEPGGPIAGSVELSFDFYEFGEFLGSCSGTYDVTYTPQGAQ